MNKLTAEKCREKFEQWFRDVEAGDDAEWHEPEYQSREWHDYISRRQLALGAWNAALEIALPVLEQESQSCTWKYDESDYYWSSACGEDWCFTDGGPEENRVKFCQGCGRPVVLEQQERERGEEE